jgi:uncharacterized protein YjbI with pentapeptide repeats
MSAEPRSLGGEALWGRTFPNSPKKPDDLGSIRGAVDDAAAVGGALWFSYLFVLFYLAVAAGAVTHADLFRENPVKLPFLNIDLPLLAFFFLAPILFLFTHGYTLLHLVMLTEKAKDYDQALREQIGADSPASDKLRRQLPSNIFIQYLAGPAKLRKSASGYALGFVAWTTLAVAPVLLLLMMQLQFLPFHSSFITWSQRIVLVLDLALIWWLWGTIRSGRETGHGRGAPFWAGRVIGLAAGVALTICAILFSWTAATFPGEWQEDHWLNLPLFRSSDEAGHPINVSLHDWIFRSPLDDITRHRLLPFANTLVLIGFNVLEELHIDNPKKEDGREFIFHARGRDLKGASIDFGSLPRVDFEGAQLEGASLHGAQLQGASLEQAHLQRASLQGAHLEGSTLEKAQLQGGSLNLAQLQGASLHLAKLQGVSLDAAQLQGASLDGAQLQGASLFGAQLQGASLGFAQLQGASLVSAQLQGASLVEARLQAASLDAAQLQGADLGLAQLQGASHDGAQLQGANLSYANLEAADLSGAALWRAYGREKRGTVLDIDAVWGPFWIDPARLIQRPWDETTYQNLRTTIEAIPAGERRDQALAEIGRLDCANSDKALAPCDPTAPPAPPGIAGLQAAASDNDYRKALAGTLKSIVCALDDDSIFVLRGVSRRGLLDPTNRLGAAGAEAPALIDFIMSPACPVSAKLTDDDKATLQEIKQDALKETGR